MESGSKLAHYEILSPLGKGGMGEVWRARDTKLGREVAIKTLPEEFAKDEDRLARFEREAKLLASLNHPNIAAIHGFEEDNGTHFLVMELVEGDTLADRLDRGAIPVEDSLKLALQIADALKAAHDKGVIHRDLKPLNIKVTDDDNVKVLDFGLAKAFAGDGAEASVSNSPTLSMAATQQGVILGTAAYMSPEQAKGRAVDKRTDIWAFGCVLYEILTGHQSFGASDVTESLAAVISLQPKWDTLPTYLHPRLREALEHCLEKQVTKRFQDIGDVKADIEKVLADPSGAIVQPVAEAVQAKLQSKLPWAVAVVLGIVVAGVAGWNLKPEPPIEPPPVSRSQHVLPEGSQFRNIRRPIVTLSPDGRQFVYNATGGIYLRSMDQLDARVIPGTEGELTINPTISPDGEWLAYQHDGQLKKIAVVGGAAVTLADVQGISIGISWDVDETILYGSAEGVMRVSADGGVPELIVSSEEEGGYPQLLPNGNAVLFNGGGGPRASGGQVRVYSLDSGESKMLFPGDRPRYVSTGHIVYAQDDVLFAVPFDIDLLEVTGGPVPLVEGVQGGPPQYAVSDSGSLVYVPGSGGRNNTILALVDRNGTVEPLDLPSADYLNPRLSPDGSRLAVELPGDEGIAIWVYDLSGETAPQRLTLEGNNTSPVWTPDGERITFVSDRAGEGLYWKSANGSGAAELLVNEEDVGIPYSWTPDGAILALTRSIRLGGRIGTFSLADSTTEILIGEDGADAAQFSPDGNWVAYESARGGNQGSGEEIFVQPFPLTGAIHQVSREGADDPIWSRDGTELFYRTGAQLIAVAFRTTPTFGFSNPQVLPISVIGNGRQYDVMPDGQRFLITIPADQANSDGPNQPQINIVLNWFEELKERVPVP